MVDYKFKEHLIDRQAQAEAAYLTDFEAGDYTLDQPLIVHNPYLINPLAAVICFETDQAQAVTVRVKGKTPQADLYQTFPKAKRHVLPILGLYPNYSNQVEVTPWLKADQAVVHTIEVGDIGVDDLVESIEANPKYMEDQLMFLCPADQSLAVAVDYAGDIRLSFNVPMIWDLKPLDNGHFLMSSDRVVNMPYFMTGLYEFSPVGKIYKEYRVEHGYHHDMAVHPSGDLITLSSDLAGGTVEDAIVILDPEYGAIKRRIYIKDFLKPGAQKSGSWSQEDWFHGNAVWYDEASNSLTLSGRHVNGMVNIDYDTAELNWIISDPEGWDEDYADYLFEPVGECDFDWPYEQHSNLITPLGEVMCFDNHNYGSQNPDHYLKAQDNFSRGVKYKIDTDQMTIEQTWQYGKERGAEFFSPYICNVVYFNEGHYLVHSGGIAFNPDGTAYEGLGTFSRISNPDTILKSKTVIVQDDEKIYELEVNSNYYRGELVSLYNKTDSSRDLVLGRGTVLGQLGRTPTWDYPIPVESATSPVDEATDIRLTDEADMLTFQGKFERGQMVLLVLQQGDDRHQYFISTAKGKRGAMCAGTFLPDDDREVRFVVSKDGLAGDYDLLLIIDDLEYDLDVQIHA